MEGHRPPVPAAVSGAEFVHLAGVESLMTCTQCGGVSANETSTFCSNCGSAFAVGPAPRTAPESVEGSVTVAHGRNVAAVVRGVIAGSLLGIVGVVYILLAVPKNKKREDALFGAWLGTVVGVMIVALTAVAIATSTGGESRAQANEVPVCLRTPAAHIPPGGISCGDWVTTTVAPAARTAPEIMTAVRTIHRDYCVQPADDVTDSGQRRSFRYYLTGPRQEPDGRWLVNCMTATTVWWDGVPLTVVVHRCKAIEPESLTVTDVETGNTITKDEQAKTSTFGRSCLQ
jgi:hypothetical protein